MRGFHLHSPPRIDIYISQNVRFTLAPGRSSLSDGGASGFVRGLSIARLNRCFHPIADSGVQLSIVLRVFDQVLIKLDAARLKDRDCGGTSKAKVAFFAPLRDSRSIRVRFLSDSFIVTLSAQSQIQSPASYRRNWYCVRLRVDADSGRWDCFDRRSSAAEERSLAGQRRLCHRSSRQTAS